MAAESQGNGAPNCLPFIKDRLLFLETVSGRCLPVLFDGLID
jgi:hypothetical protein